MKPSHLLLFSILCLATFFRLFRNTELQYWSNDEEDISGVVQRMIINKRPDLVSPNPNLGTSIGSLFSILSTPLFIITSLDPQKVLKITSLLSLLTTILLFVIGRTLKNSQLGILTSLLYASSFFASLYDRRWWTLSLNPIATSLGLVLIFNLIKYNRAQFLFLLAAITGLVFHGDPSTIVISLTALLSIVIYKIKIPKLKYLISSGIVFIFFLPIFIFELLHPGTIFKPLLTTIRHNQKISSSTSISIVNSLKLGIDTANKLFFPLPTKFLEEYFAQQTSKQHIQYLTSSFLVILILLPGIVVLRKKNKLPEIKFISVIYCFILIFFSGLLIFNLVYKIPAQRFYFSLLFPIIFTLVAYSLYYLFAKRLWLLYIFLIIYFYVNFNALNQSGFRYPLHQKDQIVNVAIDRIGNNNFSLYVFGDPYLESGGITRLFTLKGRPPRKSYIYGPLDWIYRSHSLYFIEPTDEEQDWVILIIPSSLKLFDLQSVSYEQNFSMMRLIIIDNSSRFFDSSSLRAY